MTTLQTLAFRAIPDFREIPKWAAIDQIFENDINISFGSIREGESAIEAITRIYNNAIEELYRTPQYREEAKLIPSEVINVENFKIIDQWNQDRNLLLIAPRLAERLVGLTPIINNDQLTMAQKAAQIRAFLNNLLALNRNVTLPGFLEMSPFSLKE